MQAFFPSVVDWMEADLNASLKSIIQKEWVYVDKMNHQRKACSFSGSMSQDILIHTGELFTVRLIICIQKGTHRSTVTIKSIHRKIHFFPQTLKRCEHKNNKVEAPHDPHYIMCCCLDSTTIGLLNYCTKFTKNY